MNIRNDFVSNSSSSSFVVCRNSDFPHRKFINDFLKFCNIVDDEEDGTLQICKLAMNKPIKNIFNEFFDIHNTGRITIDTINETRSVAQKEIIDKYTNLLKIKEKSIDEFFQKYFEDFDESSVTELSQEQKISEATEDLKYWIKFASNCINWLDEIQKSMEKTGKVYYHIIVDHNGGCPSFQNFYISDCKYDFDGYKSNKYKFQISDYQEI